MSTTDKPQGNWVLVVYTADNVPTFTGVGQAMSKERWNTVRKAFTDAWEAVAEGTEEEMKALEKLTGVNK